MNGDGSKGDVYMYSGFLGWLISVLPLLTRVLQVLVLVASLISLICAAWYHYKAAKNIK